MSPLQTPAALLPYQRHEWTAVGKRQSRWGKLPVEQSWRNRAERWFLFVCWVLLSVVIKLSIRPMRNNNNSKFRHFNFKQPLQLTLVPNDVEIKKELTTTAWEKKNNCVWGREGEHVGGTEIGRGQEITERARETDQWRIKCKRKCWRRKQSDPECEWAVEEKEEWKMDKMKTEKIKY